MYLGDLHQNTKETLNATDIPQFLEARYMGQIRNVTLIIIATAIMAIVTSIFAYFIDYLTSNIPVSIARFLLQGVGYSYQPQSVDFRYANEKNKMKVIYNLQ
jgi:hypothetical protein